MRLRQRLPGIVCSTVVVMSACSGADRDLPLEYRRSQAAADSNGDRADEEVEGRTTHDLHLVRSEDHALPIQTGG